MQKKENLGYIVEVQQKVQDDGDTCLNGTLELRKVPGKDRTEARRNAQKYVKERLGIDVTVNGAWVEKSEYWD